MAYGETAAIASPTFSACNPPDKMTGRTFAAAAACFQSMARPVPPRLMGSCASRRTVAVTRDTAYGWHTVTTLDDGDGLDDARRAAGICRGVFAPVQLNGAKPQQLRHPHDKCHGLVDEHSNRRHERRQLPDDRARLDRDR